MQEILSTIQIEQKINRLAHQLLENVLKSGKTMQYALNELLKFPTKAIKTLALVDRKHRRFPIKANFVGLSLSTTLKEHVEVILNKTEQKAYLK